ncbi:MAG: sirohydrochlorin chelatase, partial [Aeromicrobium erythreum]
LPDVLAAVSGPVVVVPLLLSAGFHVHHDVARAVAEHPDAVASAPLGPDWSLAEIGASRLLQSGAHRRDTVVLGGSGSSDERAMADVDEAARRLGALWGGPVRVGHLGHRGTPLPEVVTQARADGAERVVVSSYLLAPGYFQDRALESGADLVTAPLLSASPDPALVELVVRRVEQARTVRAAWTARGSSV